MTTLTRTHQIFIRAPLQSVFDYVSDLTRHPEWSDGQLIIEAVTPGPIGVGKEYVSHGEVVVQKDRLNKVRVMEYQPPYTFGFIAHDSAVGDVPHVFTFTEHQGGTLVRRTLSMSLPPILAFLFRFFIYPLVGSPSMEKSLALLKAKLEEKF